MRLLLFCACMALTITQVCAQQLTDNMTDTTKYKAGLFSIYQRFDRLRFSGYIQPQFQLTAQNGAATTYSGGDFAPLANNRFMLRRGRLRLDYANYYPDGSPRVFFVFQFDGTERGVFVRDFFGRFYNNKLKLFYVTTGLFARPFGFEINLSSSDRESPERGRMSQILMKTERDLGVMVTFEPRKAAAFFKFMRLDVGVFNGQGLSGPGEYDSHKDLIARLVLKPASLGRKITLTGGVSLLRGGLAQLSPVVYRMNAENFVRDSSVSNVGRISKRNYYGIDMQLKIPNQVGNTELRLEYITGTRTTSETPGILASAGTAFYERPFDGAYAYLLHTFKGNKHQLGIKYDFYDPNKQVNGTFIDSRFTAADVRFDTWSVGYNSFINENLRLQLWYEFVKNETTQLLSFNKDIADNVLTCRLQYRF
jgi:Phosphate-selective porin O and P